MAFKWVTGVISPRNQCSYGALLTTGFLEPILWGYQKSHPVLLVFEKSQDDYNRDIPLRSTPVG